MAPAKNRRELARLKARESWRNNLTKLNKKQSDGIFAERSFDRQVICKVTAIAIFHDKIHIMLGLFTVQKSNDIFMVQLCELFKNFDFLSQKILRFSQALLGDTLYGNGKTGFLQA